MPSPAPTLTPVAWVVWAAVFLYAAPALAHAAPARCSANHYVLLALPVQPTVINAAGEVAGTVDRRAALWSGRGGARELPLPTGFATEEVDAINGDGDVAVTAYDLAMRAHAAFIFKTDKPMMALEGHQTRALHMGAGDAVVGSAVIPGSSATEPVLWLHGKMQRLGGCCGGSAQSINSEGEVVGVSYDDRGHYHAFLWTAANGLRRIGPSGSFSAAVAINSRGHIVIQAYPDIFLHADGIARRLVLSPKYPAHPHALNDCDVIVGSFGPVSEASRAFVWNEAQGFQDLNALIPSGAAITLMSALDINNRGEIIGKAQTARGDAMGFLLRPR